MHPHPTSPSPAGPGAPLILEPAKVAELRQTADRYLAANRVGIVVGLVLVPILFGGIGAALWAIIPAPMGGAIGGGILGVGGLMFVFLLGYRHVTLKRQPFVAVGVVRGWNAVEGEYGDRALSVAVDIEIAHSLGPVGLGAALDRHRGQSRQLTLTGPGLFEKAAVGSRVLIVCMPTEEVVALDVNGQLHTP